MHHHLVHLTRQFLYAVAASALRDAAEPGHFCCGGGVSSTDGLLPRPDPLIFYFYSASLCFPFLTRVGSGTHVDRLYASSPSAHRSLYLLYRIYLCSATAT